jgi:hypothetical protein
MRNVCSATTPCEFGGKFAHLNAAIRRADRIDPFALVTREIVIAQPAADATHVGIDRARDGAAIVRIASAGRELFECVGEIGIAEEAVTVRHLTILFAVLLAEIRAPRVLDSLAAAGGELASSRRRLFAQYIAMVCGIGAPSRA